MNHAELMAAVMGAEPAADVSLQLAGLKNLVSTLVQLDDPDKLPRRATKEERQRPLENARKQAAQVRRTIRTLPIELFFGPDDDYNLLSRLDSDLSRVELLADTYLGIKDFRKPPNARGQRTHLLAESMARAYRQLTDKAGTSGWNEYSGQYEGTFPDFARAIAPHIGLSDREAKTVIKRHFRDRSA